MSYSAMLPKVERLVLLNENAVKRVCLLGSYLDFVEVLASKETCFSFVLYGDLGIFVSKYEVVGLERTFTCTRLPFTNN